MAYDAAAGALAVTDEATGRAKLVGTQGASKGFLSRGEAPQGGSLTARDSRTGHRYTLDSTAGVIVETDRAGAVVSRRNVASLQLSGVAGLAAAPTSDTTDAAGATSLYVSVANASDDGSATGPGVVELALTAPAVSTALASVPDNVGTLIQTIDANDWNPFSPDPSGIAYDTLRGKLVVSDGEIDEEARNAYPYPGFNVWEVDRVSGAGNGIMDTTSADPVNREPVGVAYDRVADDLFISKDGSTSRVWAYNRAGTGPWQLRGSLALSGFGSTDAEGLAFWNNRLFVADGSNKEVWVIGAGPDTVVATSDDVLLDNFDTAALGISDPEGIGVDPNTGHLWMVSHKDGEGMLETLQDGTPISTTHFDFPTDNPGGLEIAPSSSTSDAATVMSAWVAQRGVDNNTDPNEKDGKLHEVSIEAGSPPPPPPDPGDNLLVNGDFESGTLGGPPTSWSPNSNFTKSAEDHQSGSFSCLHSATADAGYKIEQTVDATANDQYVFSVLANPVPTTDAFRIVFKVQWRSSKALSTVVVGKITKSTAGGWDDYTATLTAPAGTTTARVFMVVSSLKTKVFVDDISLAPAP